MKCQKCGIKVSKDDAFCPECGHNLKIKVEEFSPKKENKEPSTKKGSNLSKVLISLIVLIIVIVISILAYRQFSQGTPQVTGKIQINTIKLYTLANDTKQFNYINHDMNVSSQIQNNVPEVGGTVNLFDSRGVSIINPGDYINYPIQILIYEQEGNVFGLSKLNDLTTLKYGLNIAFDSSKVIINDKEMTKTYKTFAKAGSWSPQTGQNTIDRYEVTYIFFIGKYSFFITQTSTSQYEEGEVNRIARFYTEKYG